MWSDKYVGNWICRAVTHNDPKKKWLQDNTTRPKKKLIQPSGVQRQRLPRRYAADHLPSTIKPTNLCRQLSTRAEGKLQRVELLHNTAAKWKISVPTSFAEVVRQTSTENKKRQDGIETSLSGYMKTISGEAACLSRGLVRCAPCAQVKFSTKNAKLLEGPSGKTAKMGQSNLSALPHLWARSICRCRNDRCVVAVEPVVLKHKAHTDYSC